MTAPYLRTPPAKLSLMAAEAMNHAEAEREARERAERSMRLAHRMLREQAEILRGLGGH